MLRNSSSLADSFEGVLVASGTLAGGYNWLCLDNGCYELMVGGGSADAELGFEFIGKVGHSSHSYLRAFFTDIIPNCKVKLCR